MIRKTQGKKQSARPDQSAAQKSPREILMREGTSLKDLCEQIGIKSKDLIEALESKGFAVGVNDFVTERLASSVSQIFSLGLKLVTVEEEIRIQAKSREQDLVPRPPVVTIMGHVDHGKTTLLDAIRESHLVEKEFGGITQHIGAYRVAHGDRAITFIDTPGHEAFTRLRARGATITDIVVLVVAADDGVMPQTREAINHARAAGVPIIVAINKIDKPGVDLDKVKQQLAKEGLLIEGWGGDTISVDISAKEKTNLKELLEMILLLAEVTEIKANLKVKAQGIILEARLDAKKGPLATVIIQHGILCQGDAFISGTTYGKVRALFDEKGNILKKAEPSLPAEILGFTEVPTAGDFFQVMDDVERAKKISQLRLSRIKKAELERPEHLTLDQLFKKIEEDEVKELSLVVKADVQGSVEVMTDILPNLSADKVKVKIVHAATGNITESDVLLASAANSILIGYNIKPSQKILDLAKQEQVEIRTYNVIYHLTEDLKKALTGLLEPTVKETYLGQAEIRRIFRIPKVGVIAGCLVLNGKITRNAEVRVIRKGEVIHQGRIVSLKHLKDSVTEVQKNYECGLSLEKFKDIQEGDILEAFITEKVLPK